MKSGDKYIFAICINNVGYEASLELRKVYEVLPDPAGAEIGMLRVIDESQEDYLFEADYFITIEMTQEQSAAITRAS